MKSSLKITAEAYNQLEYCSKRFNKSLDFLVGEAFGYYFAIEEHLNLGFLYGVVKHKPLTEEQKHPYILATSIHGIVFRKEGDYHKQSSKDIQISYDKKATEIIRKIAKVTRHRGKEILCSILEVYGNTIYYLKKGYKPCLFRGNERRMLNSDLSKLFFNEKK